MKVIHLIDFKYANQATDYLVSCKEHVFDTHTTFTVTAIYGVTASHTKHSVRANAVELAERHIREMLKDMLPIYLGVEVSQIVDACANTLDVLELARTGAAQKPAQVRLAIDMIAGVAKPLMDKQ